MITYKKDKWFSLYHSKQENDFLFIKVYIVENILNETKQSSIKQLYNLMTNQF